MREKAVNNPPAGPDLTTELFDQFVQAGTFRNILTTFRELCDHLELKPATDRNFYHHLKSKITSWKAKHIWTKLDKRAMRKEYKKGKACANTRVLVIGAGPCGLRTAIECSFLGAKTVIIEKRDSFSRNNVLHLWPFLINDLRNLGAKKFFGKFCAGAIDHISIRQLQCILTKVALILGVEIHNCVTYEGLEEPPEDQQDGIGWRAKISPKDHPVYEYEFDVLAGADGSRNALTGFKRKEFRGKLAIAITANFINKHSQAEAMVEEISGVAFIFNQKFFQDLKKETGIDLENIVYYKDDTHYFVMTAKKQSLLAKGVILQDHNDVELLLSHKNVSQEKLQAYARGAAKFSTNNQLPHLDFAINHYGRSDVAMFDFTSLFQAEYAARIIDRNGHRLLLALVGDSLLEPFWPTGSGCARGFLGCFDAAWMIRSWAAGIMNPLEVLAERESIYRLLAQTTPENLAKDYDRYGITPTTRYPHVVTTTVKPHEVLHLYDTKDPDLKKRFELGSQPAATSVQLNRQTSIVRSSKLLFWCQRVTDTYTNVNIQNFTTSWKNGLALCAIIHRYRPDLIDFDSLQPQHVATNNQLAFDIAEKEFGIPPAMTGTDMANHVVPDRLTMTYYVSRFYDLFKDELPPVLRTQDENEDTAELAHAVHSSPVPKASFLSRLTSKMRSKKTPTQLEKSENKENLAEIKEEKIEKEREKKTSHWSNIMSTKKHKSKDIIEIGDMDHRKSKLMDKQEKVVGLSYQKKFDEKDELDVGVRGANRVSGLAQQLQANLENSWGTGTGGKPASCTQEKPIKSKPYEPKIPITTSGQCFFCNRRVYVMERLSAEGLFFHRECFRCQHCNCMLRLGNYSFASGEHGKPGRFFCRPHYYLWGNNPATQHLAKKRPISTEVNQMPPVPIITQRPPSIISIPEDKPISPTSPNQLPDKDLLLTEPLNKKYRATPERIELENMRENISAGNVEMTEEELAKYNLGNYSTESSDSDDSDSEEIVTTRRKKSRRLHSEDEEDGDEEDDDEEYDEEDEGDFESFSEDELDSEDEVLISSTESDTTSENEEEEEEEKHTPINHIRNLSSLKAQWLSHTAAPHIKSPEELEKERKEKEEKERIERERIEQKQREKEERRRIRQEKRDSIRREKERLELERLEKARREQEEAEEEQRKQEEWERKMVERDRLDEEERQRKLKEADIVDMLGVNSINFADSDMEKDESLDEEEGTPSALKKIDTPGPSRWRDALALRFASYEDEELPPMMTPVGDKMDNSLTDDEKASLRKEKVDEESKSSPKITRRKLSPGKKLSIDMDESDNDDVTDEADRSQDSESISIDDNKLLDSLRLEEDEGLPDEKTSSPRRRIIPYGESPQKSFLAVDDEDYDDLGDESPMELDVGEDGDKLKDRDEMRKEGDGESEHLSEEQDNVLLPKDDSRLRNASATDSFTISTPTGSVTSLSSLNIGSAPNTMDFEVGKEEVVDIDTPVLEAYNPPGVITPSFKGELSNPSEKGSPKRVLHLDANLDADLDVGSGYDSKFAESIDEPVRTISPKYKDSNITDVRDKLSSAESSTHSTPVKVKSSFDPKSSILASDANKGVSSAEDSSPKHGNRNFNNAAVAKNNTDDNTGSESAGEFVLAMNSIQPSQIKTDTLKHKKKRTSSGSGTARIRSDKVREQKVSPKSSPKMSRTKRRLPRTPSGIDPELTLAMKKRGEYLLKVKAETPPKDEDRPRSESEPMSGSPTKDSANVSTAIDDSRTRSQSETTESFHTPPTSNVGSPTAAEKSPTTDTQMQFSSGVPKSESKSKEKKSRLSLMRRDKKDKDIKRRNAVRSSVVPDDVDVMAAGKKEPKKLFKKKSKKNKKKEAAAAAASHDELDYAGAVGGVEGAVCLLDDDSVFPEPDILEGLQSKLIPAEKIIKPAVRKLSIDPLLTGDLDESSTEEESRDVDETPPTTKSKKGKSPRRIWGKKFKEKRKLEEEELNEKLTRRVQKEARKQHRQQQQKRLRMAQEIQRQLQECEVKQRQLEERGIDVEKALRGEKGHVGAEAVDENSLMQQWFSLVNEKNALVRFESELMVQARELELEDRHSALEQELRQRMAVEEEKKTEADREAEKLLLEEIVEVVEQRDALVALLEEERLKEKKEDHDIESIMLRKGLLTAMKP